ncbi:MAG: Uma2 family endonuclease [Thermomicrobiales bacterium]
MYYWTAPEGSYTIEEFKQLPLEGRRWELLDGTVVRMEDHGLATSALTASLLCAMGHHVKEDQSGLILGPGCGFQLWPGSETVRVTDISFTSNERLPPRRFWNDFPRNAPDLIVENFSPFERFITAMDRIVMFLRAGTREAWFVDATTRMVTIYRPNEAPAVLSERDTPAGKDVLPGFSILVGDIFAED